jgi:hypothetical protein
VIHVANAENLGIDGNIIRSVDLCDCEYAWLLGEDDRMTKRGVAEVLEALARTRPAFLCVNYTAVDETVTFVRRDRMLPCHADTRMPAAVFLARHAWAIGFIGACVVNKALWSRVDPSGYVGTYFAHVGTIMESIRGREVAIVAEPVILNRWGPADVATWSAHGQAVFDGWREMTDRLRRVYGDAACAAAAAAFVRGHGLDTLRFLCHRRADGLYTMAAYHARIRPSGRGRAYKLAARLIALGHPFVFRSVRAVLNWSRRYRKRRLVEFASPGRGVAVRGPGVEG